MSRRSLKSTPSVAKPLCNEPLEPPLNQTVELPTTESLDYATPDESVGTETDGLTEEERAVLADEPNPIPAGTSDQQINAKADIGASPADLVQGQAAAVVDLVQRSGQDLVDALISTGLAQSEELATVISEFPHFVMMMTASKVSERGGAYLGKPACLRSGLTSLRPSLSDRFQTLTETAQVNHHAIATRLQPLLESERLK